MYIIARTYPTKVIKDIDFLIVDCPSSYNVILGQLTLNCLKAATSIYCLKLKFPTNLKIREIHGDHVLARVYYKEVFVGKENHTWIVEEDQQEPVEELKTVELVEGDASKTTKKVWMCLLELMKTCQA